ncbi:MAG: MOSC domain-containing protein [Solirubrobacteraceae bacterium]|nr:MOSC domain-containing protein [Solirubrobacteraceae bacterium]
MALLGTIAEIHRHPVKSMRGERLERVAVDASGLAGDREWALLDARRRWASAKADRERWLLVRGMLDLVATTDDDGRVRVTLPDGRVAHAGDPATDATLSEHLGRDLALDRGDRGELWGRHHDAAPVHLVTTATLRALAGADDRPLDPRRLRPNLVVRTADGADGFVEDAWIGRELRVGSVRMEVIQRTIRCVMTTRAQGDDVTWDPTVLPRIGQRNGTGAGVYLVVREPGEVAVGDPVVTD